MVCPTQEQLARVELGVSEEANVGKHIEQCTDCGARLATMRLLTEGLSAAHARFDEGHSQARAELVARLPAIDRQAESRKSWKRIRVWIGALTMRQRMALGGVGAAIVMALFLLWGGGVVKPVSAMEQMAEKIRQAKTCKANAIIELGRAENALPDDRVICKWYWSAPERYRVEERVTHPRRDEKKGLRPAAEENTEILFNDGSSLQIDHNAKVYHRVAAGAAPTMPAYWMLEKLGKYSGQADRDLGTKAIGDKQARGFQINSRKIDADSPPGRMEIWIDPESNLPVLVQFETNFDDVKISMRWLDIEWNVSLDAKLFEKVPPKGYAEGHTDVTPAKK